MHRPVLAALAATLMCSPVLAQQYAAARGERDFRACLACHYLEPDRNMTGPSLADSLVRVLPRTSNQRVMIAYSDIAALAFTGRDTAAGKSWEAWVKKYVEKKAAGEKDIGLEPEALE